MDHTDWKGKLTLWWWVFTAVALYLLMEGWPVGFPALVLVRGAGFESQVVGRGNGCQRLLNSFNTNLIRSSSISVSYPMGIGLDKVEALGW